MNNSCLRNRLYDLTFNDIYYLCSFVGFFFRYIYIGPCCFVYFLKHTTQFNMSDHLCIHCGRTDNDSIPKSKPKALKDKFPRRVIRDKREFDNTCRYWYFN